MSYQIGQFNICSSDADFDIFFNAEFRVALTEAINYQLGEYQAEHPDEDIDPGELILFFYPHSAGYWFEIKQWCDNPRIRLIDSMDDWLNKK